jgi:hypothetical protein
MENEIEIEKDLKGGIDDLIDNIVINTRQNIDMFLLEEKPAELMALYDFYYYTAKWQKTNQPRATISYVMKGLKWGETKVRKNKKILIRLGLIRDFRAVDKKTGKINGWYIKVCYIWSKENLLNRIKTTLSKIQQVVYEGTNALSDSNLNALSDSVNFQNNADLAVPNVSPSSTSEENLPSPSYKWGLNSASATSAVPAPQQDNTPQLSSTTTSQHTSIQLCSPVKPSSKQDSLAKKPLASSKNPPKIFSTEEIERFKKLRAEEVQCFNLVRQDLTPSLETQKSPIYDPTFDFNREMLKLENDKQVHVRIIALFWYAKGTTFENEGQYKAQFRRLLKGASQLKHYSFGKILKAMVSASEESKKVGYDWGLETAIKKIDKV